ncbi:MAG TPA: HAD family hydrolase [Polyangiaceae bacterium]|nr:HAD family hydrolase [Polyangiaceae bacterium]
MDLALFDFDGTITDGDGFLPFIHLAVSRARALAGTLWLSPLIAGHRAGWVSSSRMRERIAWVAFRGRPRAALAALGERYAADVLEGRVRREASQRIAWHQARGDRVLVVSASLDCYLAPWCRARGLELICSELEVREGVCTGRYRGGDCSGPEKARRVLERCEIGSYRQVFAYGDTSEDRELLALAQRRFFRWRELAPGSDISTSLRPSRDSLPRGGQREPPPRKTQ